MFEKFINKNIEDKIGTRNDFLKLLKITKKPIAISFVNPFSYQLINRKKNLIDNIDYLFSDGALLCALSNFRRKRKIDRVSFDFSSIADNVFTFASDEDKSIALVGGNKSEIQTAKKYIESKYPKLKITYFRDGYFSKDDFQTVICDLDDLNVDIIIAGMGTPLQDEFIVSVKKLSKSVKLSFTCGGFLTQTALKGDYYHPLIKRLGLRWLQRCVMHKHVRSRLLKDYPLFFLSYLLNIKLT
jgi:UDP-Gal:alpha-D-GlcNAc-diphosphoundecaprenol beta-1,4-galactosyltransferase